MAPKEPKNLEGLANCSMHHLTSDEWQVKQIGIDKVLSLASTKRNVPGIIYGLRKEGDRFAGIANLPNPPIVREIDV